jgi:hypothetical protein
MVQWYGHKKTRTGNKYGQNNSVDINLKMLTLVKEIHKIVAEGMNLKTGTK